jgi:predicted transposase YbfD/YdcC
MVSAWAASNVICLGQVKVSEKSNEITAIPELLSELALEGCIVTIDSMGCQKTIARLGTTYAIVSWLCVEQYGQRPSYLRR